MSLCSKKILLGMTGGIACYKIPNLVRLLVKQGAEVQVIMTEAATRFVTPLTLESVSRRPVVVRMFPENEFVGTRHIDLAEWPDVIVIAPATANFLGKMASGISDDLLTTVMCATTRPVLVAPAMNPGMWSNRITQRNFETVTRDLGWESIGPEAGEMACDSSGVGRMSEPEAIFDCVSKLAGGAGSAGSKKKG
jgi:phosphopantothenoylcysteine decarboxylase / phosphopantothenate---cysteine ligase